MKKYVTKNNFAALARIAALCGLAVLSIALSPAFAATLSAAWASMTGPLGAFRDGLPSFGSSARSSMTHIISLL